MSAQTEQPEFETARKRVERIEPPLTRAQAAAQASGRQVTLTVGEVTLDLGRSSIDQVLDALATAGIRAQGGKP